MLCEKESKSFQDITPEFLIQRITGREVQEEQLKNVKNKVGEQMQNGGLLQLSPLVK